MLKFFIGIVLYDEAYNVQFFWKKWQRCRFTHQNSFIGEFYQIIEGAFLCGKCPYKSVSLAGFVFDLLVAHLAEVFCLCWLKSGPMSLALLLTVNQKEKISITAVNGVQGNMHSPHSR